MIYELGFLDEAWEEWNKLDGSIREQFKKKMGECLSHPRVPSAKMSGHPDRYKIKLRSAGYRLVYEVQDGRLIVLVVAVGKRERNAVYRAASGDNPNPRFCPPFARSISVAGAPAGRRRCR